MNATHQQDRLPFHPFANKFPLLNGDEFKEFVADIKKNGLREKITLYQGKILEGRNRYRACLNAKVEPRFEEFEGDDAAALAFVISKNIHRRHLKAKEKREAIAALLKVDPKKSNRQIAEEVKSDHHVVERVRRNMESTGTISQLSETVGKDGKTRPAKGTRRTAVKPPKEIVTGKAAPPPPAKPAEPVTCEAPALARYTEPEPDGELALLREFARFVIGRRAKLTFEPKDDAKFKELCAKVQATLGIAE